MGVEDVSRGLEAKYDVVSALQEEVWHSHVCYALMNIPGTKIHQYNNRKCSAAKIMMGLGFFFVMLTSQK